MNRRLAWSIFRYVLSLLVIFTLGIAVLLWWALGGSLPTRSKLPLDQVSEAPIEPAPKTLVVVSYNVAHGQGVKEKAWDYRDKETTLSHLSQLSEAMSRMDADIFLLQEVDLDSHRTHRINQLEFFKKSTKHPYHACALVFEKNYLPYPYWPPAHHIGYVRAANCILSKFPLSNHERIIFDKPRSNPFWYNWGYLDRGIERVDVDIGSKKLALLNVHLEAWETEAREIQIKVINDYLQEIHIPGILAGDFNTVPPDAPKMLGFADEPDMDFTHEQTFRWFFTHANNLKIPVLTGNNNVASEIFTFPSNNPDRRLDHIFLFGKGLSFINFRIVKEAAEASDHLPVMATIKIED
jgi:endonuclease/exonuclease/phosphatase family metal-dependent hydrolase